MDDLTIAPLGDKSIRMTRSFRAPKAMVFKAWTTPELLRQWLLGPGDAWTMPVCDVDLRVGGGYRFQWKHDTNGSELGMRGEYLEIVPGERLVSTERFDESWYPGGATIVMTLTETDGVTVVTQDIEYDSPEARDVVLRSPMESGVRESYLRMERLLT